MCIRDRTYNIGSPESWINGTRYKTLTGAVRGSTGVILYVWKDNNLILTQNIKDQMICYIRDQANFGTRYMYCGVEIGLEAMPDHCISSFINEGWDVIPLCRRIARHYLRSL